jgi:DNA-binding Xre family transcriptional regulator/predicted XRE-type DNA-binding protein
MMKIKIRAVAEKNGLKSAYALQKALSISPTMASRLWKGEFDKIGINTLEKLCEHFQCQTNDFLEYPLTRNDKTQKSNDTQTSNTELSKKVERATQLSNTELSKVESSSDNENKLTLLQVAERLGVSRKSVNDYVNKGLLKATKGKQNHNFVVESDLLEFIKRRDNQ